MNSLNYYYGTFYFGILVAKHLGFLHQYFNMLKIDRLLTMVF